MVLIAGNSKAENPEPTPAAASVGVRSPGVWHPEPVTTNPNWQTDPKTHVGSRLSHALFMVAALVQWVDNPALDPIVQIACVEDWLTNYRLLIEFLVMRPRDNRAHATTLASDWKSPESVVVGKLRRDYGWASQDVSHIGIPGPNELVANAHPDALKMRVGWILEVADEFVAELTRIGSSYKVMVENGVADARAGL